ncbi:MAG: LacI family DNA-binding transcriptional regulator [Spirochaetales bacterium]|nr:LacI family DNA-binding transcriptional regulator [Spirochaetales bacterium]
MPTIKDLARIAGVSIGTVSNVINNKSSVTEESRRKVEEAIRLTDYKVNLHARGMILKKSFNIGLVVPSILDPFFPKLADVIEQECEKLDMNVILSSSNYSPDREIDKIEQMLAKNVDGIILIPESDRNRSYVAGLLEKETPLVLLARRYNDLRAPYVVADNRKTAEDGINYLLGKGYDSIGFLVSPLMNTADEDRLAGIQNWKNNHSEAAVSIHYCAPLPVHDRKHSMEHQLSQGYEKGLELIRDQRLPRAVFANNDYIALGFMKACTESSIRLPDDVALLGVSRQFPKELLSTELSSFDPHSEIMGSEAVRILKELMDHPERGDESTHHIEIGMSLIEGMTT